MSLYYFLRSPCYSDLIRYVRAKSSIKAGNNLLTFQIMSYYIDRYDAIYAICESHNMLLKYFIDEFVHVFMGEAWTQKVCLTSIGNSQGVEINRPPFLPNNEHELYVMFYIKIQFTCKTFVTSSPNTQLYNMK